MQRTRALAPHKKICAHVFLSSCPYYACAQGSALLSAQYSLDLNDADYPDSSSDGEYLPEEDSESSEDDSDHSSEMVL